MKKQILLWIFLGFGLMVYAQPYELPELKYSYEALSPWIDSRTMEIHYTRHHQGYVNNLNKAIQGTRAEGMSLENLQLEAVKLGDAVRNNGGGHYNHTLFWDILSPDPQEPSDALKDAIEVAFVSIDSLKSLVNQAAGTRFGSGWAWLVVTPDKKLAVTSTANQDNPLMEGMDVRGIPILGIDVWEHAYYLSYQNRRGEYLHKIWNVIDWGVVSERYAEAVKSNTLRKLK